MAHRIGYDTNKTGLPFLYMTALSTQTSGLRSSICLAAMVETWTPFQTLSTYAVVFSGLSALFGVYCVLFVLAIWGTYRHSGVAHKRLRWMTIILFLNLCLHYITRAVTLGRSRLENPPTDEFAKRGLPLTFITVLTTTIAGTMSDGLLAWRFYVVSGRRPYALGAVTIAVAINTMLGLSGNFQFLIFYTDRAKFTNELSVTVIQISAAWGWCMLGINTVLSALMIWKIVRVSRTSRSTQSPTGLGRYAVVVEAIAESALVTWIGLALYGIGSLAPQGKITTHWDIGYDAGCILPMFFGISQCLIIARLGFAFDSSSSDVEGGRGLAATYPTCGCARAQEAPKGIAIMVKRETESVSVDEHGVPVEEGKSKLELFDEQGHVKSRELVVETTVALPT